MLTGALVVVAAVSGALVAGIGPAALLSAADDEPDLAPVIGDRPPPSEQTSQQAVAASGTLVVSADPRDERVVAGEPAEIVLTNVGEVSARSPDGGRLARWQDGGWTRVRREPAAPPGELQVVHPVRSWLLLEPGDEHVLSVGTSHLEPGWYQTSLVFFPAASSLSVGTARATFEVAGPIQPGSVVTDPEALPTSD